MVKIVGHRSYRNKSAATRSFRDLFSQSLLSNIKASYNLEIVNLLGPLITLPYLARILGPGIFGLLALTQSFMLYIGVVIEYGFKFSATREASQCRDSSDKLSDLLAGVIGARVLLSFGGLLIAITMAHLLSHFKEHPYLFWASFYWIIARGNALDWLYRGLERTKTYAYLEIIPSVLSIGAIFLFVRSPDEVWLVPFIRGSAGITSLIVSIMIAYKSIPVQFPAPSLVIRAFKSGWSAFIYMGAANLSAVGNTFILGLVAPVQIVGYYAGAEKIMRALLVFVRPATWSLYPHLSHLVVTSIQQAAKLARYALATLTVLGSGIALLVICIIPYLVNIVLGAGFEQAIPALRVLMGILPLAGIIAVLGTQWMFALGMEKQYTIIVAATGLAKLAGIILLAPYYGHVGVAFAVLIAQAADVIAVYILLIRKRLNPFQKHLINLPGC